MAIVELIQMLSKSSLMTYQMNSPLVFAYESDPFHRIFLELLIIEDGRITSVQASQTIKVYIKRKPSTGTNENVHQPSPQVIYQRYTSSSVFFVYKVGVSR